MYMLAAALIGGCGGPEGPELAPVKGVVLYKGEPVEGAAVDFHPQVSSPWRPHAITDAEGRFEMTSVAPGDGAVPGTHKVTVVVRPVRPFTEEELEQQRKTAKEIEAITDPQERRKAAFQFGMSLLDGRGPQAGSEAVRDRRNKNASQPLAELPAKYANPETSGLTFEVKAGAPNDFQIVLTD